MKIPSPLRMTTLGLAVSSLAFAQNPPTAPAPTPPDAQAPMHGTPEASSQLPIVIQSSRVRAFNAGPDGGEARGLYLQNGSVVDLTTGLGGQLGEAGRKGEKIAVTGTKSEINGQSIIEAASVRLGERTFSVNAASANAPGSGALAEGEAAPPPGSLQTPAPVPSQRRKTKAAPPAPCGVSDDEPPPPRDGIAPPPPPGGMAPPPPQD